MMIPFESFTFSILIFALFSTFVPLFTKIAVTSLEFSAVSSVSKEVFNSPLSPTKAKIFPVVFASSPFKSPLCLMKFLTGAL